MSVGNPQLQSSNHHHANVLEVDIVPGLVEERVGYIRDPLRPLAVDDGGQTNLIQLPDEKLDIHAYVQQLHVVSEESLSGCIHRNDWHVSRYK